ncbi:MAG: hypothetical protein ACE5I1_13150 [bacterium]
MTKQTIEAYRITYEELQQLQYYLSNRIELRGVFNQKNRTLPPIRELALQNEDLEDIIIIPAGSPGQATKVWEDEKIPLFGGILKIRVCFDAIATNCENQYLTFRPDQNGMYKLEIRPWDNAVIYYDKKYNCIGCANTYLYVPVKMINRFIQRRRVLSGRKY